MVNILLSVLCWWCGAAVVPLLFRLFRFFHIVVVSLLLVRFLDCLADSISKRSLLPARPRSRGDGINDTIIYLRLT